MPWKAIADFPGCKPVTLPSSYPRLFVFRTSGDDTGWPVGPYKEMTRFAADLCHDSALRDVLSSNRIRIGLRRTDVPPAASRAKIAPVCPFRDSQGGLKPSPGCFFVASMPSLLPTAILLVAG
jgi:hypothetical protein